MKYFSKLQLVYLLILSFLFQPFAPGIIRAAEEAAPDVTENILDDFEITRMPGDIPDEDTLQEAFKDLKETGRQTRFLTDLLTKNIRFAPADRQYLADWATVSRAIKNLQETDPTAYERFVSSNFLEIPDKIREQYDSLFPLPNYHKWLLEALWRRMEENDPFDPEQSGFGGEFLDVSRILADYDSESRVESKEGEDDKPADQENNISSHYFENVHAFDVAAIDYIRCTKVSFKPEGGTSQKLKVTKREKLAPTEIEVAWQDNPPANNPLGTYPSGANDINPNLLTNLFGASFDDLARRLGKDGVAAEIMKILNDNGFKVTPEALRLLTDWNGESNDLSTLFARLGQVLTLSGFSGTTTQPIFPVGTNLDQTIDFMGAALLTNLFPKLTITALQSQSLEEVGEKLAREGLGRQFLGSGYKLEGNSSQELLMNLATQYFTGKILGLEPTTSLTSFPLTNQTEIKQAIGTIAISQRLLLALDQIRQGHLPSTLGNRFQSQFVDQATDTDRLLGLPAGTTAAFAANPSASGFAQFAQTVGGGLLTATVDQYQGADPLIKNRAMNLNLQFGPEDLYLPDAEFYPSTLEQLAEIERFYRPFISDDDWQDFTRRYKALPIPPLTESDILDDEAEIRAWLSIHLVRQPDLLGTLLSGPITTETLTAVGQQILAKIDPKPFNQLALLNYLTTGTVWTIPAAGNDVHVPVINLDELAGDKLGLLAGDFERIWRKNRFPTEVLPRLAGDYLGEALANAPKDNAFISGTARQSIRTDDFIRGQLANLAAALGELKHVTPAAASAIQETQTIIAQARPENWQGTLTSPREARIDQFIQILGVRLPDLTKSIAAATLQPVLNEMASLVAGRPVMTPADLKVPTAPLDRSFGLTKESLSQLVRGQVTPAQFISSLGSQYLTGTIWGAAKPDVMLNDLTQARQRSRDPNYGDFFKKYRPTFDQLARRLAGQLGLDSNQTGLSGQAIFGIFTGNSQAPFSRILGSALHQSLLGQPGNLWASTSSPAALVGAIGLRQVFQANGFVGRFDLTGDLTNQIVQKIFEQRSGLLWAAGGAAALLLKNGLNFPGLLQFPADLKQQFSQFWDPQNPQKVIDELLKNPAVWQQLNISGVMQNNLGPVGAAAANALISMFTSGGQSQDLLGAVKDNIGQFLPAVSHTLNLPVDLNPLYQAIRSNNQQGILQSLGGLGGSLIDSRLAGLTTILFSHDKSPKTVMNWVTNNLPGFLGDSANPQVINFAQTVAAYFFDKTLTDPKQKNQLLQTAAGQLGQLVGIPFAGDVMKLASDPRGFGLAAVTATLASRLGLANLDYAKLRDGLFGPDPQKIQDAAAKLRAANPHLTPQQASQQAQQAVAEETKALRKDIQYTLMDQTLGLPPGVTKAMFEGDSNAQLDALFLTADRFLNVPPEARIALELIKNKGDLSQISNLTYGYLDGQLSNLVGVPLPPGFTKQTADFVTGQTSFEQYSGSLGNFAVGQVSGVIDQKLGLPSGTVFAFRDGLAKMSETTAQIQALGSQREILLAKFNLDPTNTTLVDELNAIDGKISLNQEKLAGVQGAMAGLVVNLVIGGTLGKQIAQIDRALGLPPGTASFILNTAVSSIFTHTAFLSVMASALPFFVASLLLGPLLNDLFGGLLGGGSKAQAVTICTAGGYYPYVKKEDDEKENREGLVARRYDPYSDLDHYRSIEDRLKEKSPEQVAKDLDLWPGYPGEFYGEDVSRQAYDLAKQEAARWKVRELLGELLLMRSRYHEPDLLPRQLIAFNIPKAARGEDGDYLKYYDGRDTSDPRFVVKNSNGQPIGFLDQPFIPDILGYGNDLRGSGNARPEEGDPFAQESLAQKFYGIWNVGLWTEFTQQFNHHVHAGY